MSGLLNLLQDLAWLIAGLSVGGLMIIMSVTLRSASQAEEVGAPRKKILADVLDGLEELRDQPHNLALREQVALQLTRAAKSEDALEVVALLVSLHPQNDSIVDLVRSSGFLDHIVHQLERGRAEDKIGALELIGLSGDRGQLTNVLVLCTAPEAAVRRMALRTLSDLDPVTAFDLHVRATRTEGPWVLEQLAELVQRSETVSQYRSLHGERRLADVIALLTSEIAAGDERRAFAAIETLRLIDHRSTIAALTHGLRSRSPIIKSAAAEALLDTPAGRRALDRVSERRGDDVAPEQAELVPDEVTGLVI